MRLLSAQKGVSKFSATCNEPIFKEKTHMNESLWSGDNAIIRHFTVNMKKQYSIEIQAREKHEKQALKSRFSETCLLH